MNIVVKKVGEEAFVKEFVNGMELEDMQSMVGGLIECVRVAEGIDLWVNDEGKIYNLPINFVLGTDDCRLLDTINGDVFFAGNNDHGESTGLTDGQITWIKNNLSNQCILSDDEGNMAVVPVWIYNPSAS